MGNTEGSVLPGTIKFFNCMCFKCFDQAYHYKPQFYGVAKDGNDILSLRDKNNPYGRKTSRHLTGITNNIFISISIVHTKLLTSRYNPRKRSK